MVSRRWGWLAGALCVCTAGAAMAEHPTTFDKKIAELARIHHVPERLIHRVIMRESRYNPSAIHAGNYGLMQIRLGTARTMGYAGTATGLCDGPTNLTYAVPYLANAYLVADRDEDRAVRLYASGFYYLAKRQGALSSLRTAQSAPLAPDVVAYAPPPPANPIAALFGIVTVPVVAAAAAVEANQADRAAMANADTLALADSEATPADVPLPPHRPAAFSTARFIQLASRQEEREAASGLRGDAE